MSKWKHVSKKISITRGLKDSYSLSNKQIKYILFPTNHPVGDPEQCHNLLGWIGLD